MKLPPNTITGELRREAKRDQSREAKEARRELLTIVRKPRRKSANQEAAKSGAAQ
jgi:hypothetical protein